MKLLRKYIHCLLEDASRRQAMAQDMIDAGMVQTFRTPSAHSAPASAKVQLGRPVKKLFAKHADHNFMNSLVTIHWTRSENVIKILQGSSKDELSAQVHRPGNVHIDSTGGGGFGQVGILIKGLITLLANDMNHIFSGAGIEYAEDMPERTKSSGANKGIAYRPSASSIADAIRAPIVLDAEDWDPMTSGEQAYGSKKDDMMTNKNEALVDNWRVAAIIVSVEPVIKAWEQVLEKKGIDPSQYHWMTYEEANSEL